MYSAIVHGSFNARKFRGDLKINIESNSETLFVIITLQTFWNKK